jgi:hypothetical protein
MDGIKIDKVMVKSLRNKKKVTIYLLWLPITKRTENLVKLMVFYRNEL